MKRFLYAFYGYAFLFDFMVCYAIYTAYFELVGISVAEMGLLLATWSGTALLFEIFTGALSDRFDRRYLLVAAPLIKSLCFVVWLWADGNFWLYALGFSIWSFAGALYSGTGEALLYESLESWDRADDFERVYGKVNAAESLGIGAGLLLGGLLAGSFGMEATFWASLPPLFLASALGLLLADSRCLGGDADEEVGYFENIRLAFGEFRALPQLRFVALYIGAGLVFFEELEEFDQLFYTAVKLPLSLFGVAGAIGLLLYALGSIYAHRLSKMLWLAWFLPILSGVLFIVSARATTAYFVLILEFSYLLAIVPTVLAESHFQHLIESSARATTTSILEFIQNIMALLLALLFGWLAQSVGVLSAYGWAGGLLIVFGVWTYVNQRRGKVAWAESAGR